MRANYGSTGATLGMLVGFSFIVLDPIYTKLLVKLNYFLANTFSLPTAYDGPTFVTYVMWIVCMTVPTIAGGFIGDYIWKIKNSYSKNNKKYQTAANKVETVIGTQKAVNVMCMCELDELALITISDPQKDYVAICPNCSKQIFILTCKGCGETFPYPEEDPGLDHETHTWECEKCGESNKIPYPSELLKTEVINYKDAPKETKKELEKKDLNYYAGMVLVGLIGLMFVSQLWEIIKFIAEVITLFIKGQLK